MPISGARASPAWRNPFARDPPTYWFKLSVAIYIVAMIPYLLASLSYAQFWKISQAEYDGLSLAGAVTFLINALFDFWVSWRLGGPICGHGQGQEWFMIGSMLYITASVFYFVGPLLDTIDTDGRFANTSLMLYITAAFVFVFHALVCLVGTYTDKMDPETRKTYFIECKCRRWQDFDWYTLADLTFMGCAIFDVFYMMGVLGALDTDVISNANWMLNAMIYMIAAFSDDFGAASQSNENSDGALSLLSEHQDE
mmetsp:Transcript_19822/g.45427  ORF Transcript_19822/g.45427 Transcript_19822/m.45427 type:complete len:254 (-) Transcript_19822:281-1042(-)